MATNEPMIEKIKYDESNEKYHSSLGLSCSGLKLFAKTPKHYILSKTKPRSESGPQRLGTLAHMAILEPEKFETNVVRIDGSRNSHDVQHSIMTAEQNGYYVCKTKEFEHAHRLAKAVKDDKGIARLLQNGRAEVSLRCVDPITGLVLKCRPDYLREDIKAIVDVKTFSDLSTDNIEKQIARMKYHWQSAFYLYVAEHSIGMKTKNFVHIFIDVENEMARAVVLGDASLDKAFSQMEPHILRFKECFEKNQWPGYPEGITTVELPSYEWSKE